MASEAAKAKYPDRERAHPFEPMASLANAQYVIEREREAYDAGRVDGLREAADFVPPFGMVDAAQVRATLHQLANEREEQAR